MKKLLLFLPFIIWLLSSCRHDTCDCDEKSLTPDKKRKIALDYFEEHKASFTTRSKLDPLDAADGWIKLHRQSDFARLVPASFVLAKDSLDAYTGLVEKENNQKVKYYHIFFARRAATSDSSTLVISAANADGHHIFCTVDGTQRVLEHIIPCPTCVDVYANNGNGVGIQEDIKN